MDTGVAQGLYTGVNTGLYTGTGTGIDQGVNNGVLNEVLIPNGIVRNGLVLYLDAANPYSYPGSGATWYDLSGSARNATLENNPIYYRQNKGYFYFDGTKAVSFSAISSAKTLSAWINAFQTDNYNFTQSVGDKFYINGSKYDIVTGGQYVTNGNFNSDTSSWSTQGGSISWQNDTGGDGSTGYLRFNVSSNTAYDRFSQNVGVASNTTYLLSFWYRTSSGITGDMAAIFSSNSSTLANQSWAVVIGPNTSWTKVSVLYTSGGSFGYPNLSMSKIANIGSGTVDFDAISLQKVSLPNNRWLNITTKSTALMYSVSKLGKSTDTLFNGNIAHTIVYNRELEDAEISQNYLATKQRFGL